MIAAINPKNGARKKGIRLKWKNKKMSKIKLTIEPL